MAQFPKGVFVKQKTSKYGEYFNVGINTAEFFCEENKISESGWMNFNIKQGKSGKWYAEVQGESRQEQSTQTKEPKQDERYSDNEQLVEFGEDEIPF